MNLDWPILIELPGDAISNSEASARSVRGMKTTGTCRPVELSYEWRRDDRTGLIGLDPGEPSLLSTVSLAHHPHVGNALSGRSGTEH